MPQPVIFLDLFSTSCAPPSSPDQVKDPAVDRIHGVAGPLAGFPADFANLELIDCLLGKARQLDRGAVDRGRRQNVFGEQMPQQRHDLRLGLIVRIMPGDHILEEFRRKRSAEIPDRPDKTVEHQQEHPACRDEPTRSAP